MDSPGNKLLASALGLIEWFFHNRHTRAFTVLAARGRHGAELRKNSWPKQTPRPPCATAPNCKKRRSEDLHSFTKKGIPEVAGWVQPT